jgi:hypothetical protein
VITHRWTSQTWRRLLRIVDVEGKEAQSRDSGRCCTLQLVAQALRQERCRLSAAAQQRQLVCVLEHDE